MSELQGKVALVTGASRGAGRAIAARLAREGMAVALLARNRAELEGAAAAIRAAGGAAIITPADVADERAVQGAFDATAQQFGGLDAAILNAGIALNSPVEDATLAQWRTTLDTNLTGPFLCARAAVPLLRQRGGGNIIAIGSGAGKQGYPTMAAYSASKFGLHGLMQALAAEVGDAGIKASIINPGSILTAFGSTPARRQPGKKYLEPDDVAEAVVALLCQSPRAWTQELNLWPFK